MIDLLKTEAEESILELRAGKPNHLCRQKTQENIRMQEHKTIGNYSIVDSTEVLDCLIHLDWEERTVPRGLTF